MGGADIYQVAKNCRTSVEMIEKFYAAHLQNTLDTAAINVCRSKLNSYRDKIPANDRTVRDRHQLSLLQTHAGGR